MSVIYIMRKINLWSALDNRTYCGRHSDCGLLIYDMKAQDVHAGGSGCGCCASVLCSKILPDLQSGKLRNIIFIATGALLSAATAQQGKSIPSVTHLVNLASA